MESGSQRWRQVTTSQYAWENDALDVLRDLLPDAAPFNAWTNFQFTDGGRIHEVDALVITPKGGFVIEIKSWSGSVQGDQGTWTQVRRDGSRMSCPNPANLTAEKVRALAGLVRERLAASGTGKRKTPFEPHMPGFVKVFPPTYYRDRFSSWEECNRFAARSLEDVIIHEDPDTVAGFLVEPVDLLICRSAPERFRSSTVQP